MAAYIIADIDIHDPGLYDEYRRQVIPTIEKFAGRLIVRGGKHTTLEGNWTPSRLIVIEFPNMDQLQNWYRSSEYAPLLSLRKRATVTNAVAVEGIPVG